MTWTCEGCGTTTPAHYRWDHECPNVYRVHSPTQGTRLVTGDWGHAKGRAGALNQACVTNDRAADWIVQTATPRWGTP